MPGLRLRRRKEYKRQKRDALFFPAFYGMPLKYYFAMDLESIAALNDSVGGVTLTSLETLRLSGKIVTKGEVVTLLGKDARDYVQYRDSKLLDSNNQRIKRQRQYLTEFSQKVLKMTKKNISVPVKLFKKSFPIPPRTWKCPMLHT